MDRERESPPPSKVAAQERIPLSRKPRFTEADVDILARLILLDERNLYTPLGCKLNLERESAAWASLQEEFCRRASYPREIEDLKKKGAHLRLHEGNWLEEIRRTLSCPLPEPHTSGRKDAAGLPGPSCHPRRTEATASASGLGQEEAAAPASVTTSAISSTSTALLPPESPTCGGQLYFDKMQQILEEVQQLRAKYDVDIIVLQNFERRLSALEDASASEQDPPGSQHSSSSATP
ncbi:uncharacterized protein LOC115087213 isoform X2 [Rhinatrema bivittatum]|uniref:uncharacterized protein LOC115087213 isoform X2 n=1 Tax=Rhinatrema bivittatum TaxID=194408 RepID=UPI00112CEB99|nr:uncharacterized protein LOC115087213 isoform X2 [Rhinatrema bivittatum]